MTAGQILYLLEHPDPYFIAGVLLVLAVVVLLLGLLMYWLIR